MAVTIKKKSASKGAVKPPLSQSGLELSIEYWDTNRLIPYGNNAKTHPESQVTNLVSSIKKYDFDVPIVVDGDGIIIKGHGRRLAAIEAGISTVPVIVRKDMSEAEVKASRIADNKTAESPWDEEALFQELELLQQMDGELFTGFEDAEFVEMMEVYGNEEHSTKEDEGDPDHKGEALEKVLIHIKEPTAKVVRGDIVKLGPHTLVCGSVFKDHQIWAELLEKGMLFLPYPGPFVALMDNPKHHMLLVQPDAFIAGHIIDRWTEVHGANHE